jgi:FHA domain
LLRETNGEDAHMGTDDDQFIVPPPGIVAAPAEARVVEPEPVEADDLITLPPGIIDSGTYRVSHERASKPGVRPADSPVFFPSGGIGMAPVAPPAAEPVPQPVDDATRVSVGRRRAPAWRLLLPDGDHVLVEQTTLVGRDPAQSAEWPDALLLPIVDTGKTISKTHAALELTAGGQLVVHDLDSTNGVFLEYPGGSETLVEPGVPGHVEHGAELRLGQFIVSVERS